MSTEPTTWRSEPAPFPADLPALTSLRFFLALGVVLFHYHLTWPWDDQQATGLFERARLGVDVFFILSGFVLTHVYRHEIDTGRLGYGRFLMARIGRIYPAHLAVLGLMVVIVVGGAAAGASFESEKYSPLALLATALLVQSWFPTRAFAEWNGPAWSLSAEWFAYLAFPAFAWVGVKLKSRPWLLIGLAVVLFLALDVVYRAAFGAILPHAEARMGILRIAPEFLYGVGLYRLGQHWTATRLAPVFAGAFAIAILLMMHLQLDDRLIVAMAGPLVLSLAMISKSQQTGVLANRWLVLAGEASFALYLIHFPLMIAWKGASLVVAPPQGAYAPSWTSLAALFAVTLVATFALHYLVEAPARRAIRRLADRCWPRPARPAGAPGSQPPDY